MTRGDLLLMTLLWARTDDSLESDDLVKRDMGTDVEDSQHSSLSRSHSEVTITRDDDDAVNLVLECVNPLGHELACGVGLAGIPEVLGIDLLTSGVGGITQVVLDSQLDDMLVKKYILRVLKVLPW